MKDSLIEITDIKMTKKGKFALFSVDGFLFSVDETILSAERLEIGGVYSTFDLDRIRRLSDIDKAKEKAFSLLSMRQYSRKQLSDMLRERFDEYTSEAVTERIEELGYIDDRKFAASLLEGVVSAKHMSPRAARNYLLSKGISPELTDELIEGYAGGETEDIKELFERKYSRYDLTDRDDREKVKASLFRKGFSVRDIMQAMEEYTGERDYE